MLSEKEKRGKICLLLLLLRDFSFFLKVFLEGLFTSKSDLFAFKLRSGGHIHFVKTSFEVSHGLEGDVQSMVLKDVFHVRTLDRQVVHIGEVADGAQEVVTRLCGRRG